MALRKKQRARKPVKPGKQHLVRLEAYGRGRADGYRRGREDGFAQGQANAHRAQEPEGAAAAAVAVAVPEQPRPKPTVLVVTAGIITSLQIGVIQPFDALNKRDHLQYDVKLEHEVTRDMIAEAETIVFVRNVEPAAYELLEWAQELGKRTVYVIDDNFLEIQPTTPIGLYYSDPVRRETFVRFLRNAGIVKVDSQEFGDYIRERFNKRVVYFPASVDFDWLDGQERGERDGGQIVIGYEGGSKEDDFAPVVPALKKIYDYYGGFVRLEFFGYLPASLADHPGVRYEEGNMEYREFIQKLNRCSWDIGLAPLAANPFNNGKTNNKFREYGACRIPGIYSDCPVYAPWVAQGETGYLVRHTEQGWYAGIKAMIENPSMRQRIRRNAEAAARHHFSLHTCMDNWKKYVL